MWQVTARGNQGRTYTYLVDAPDYAPEGAVWESACRQHGIERRERGIRETLSLLPENIKIKLICPAGHWQECRKILDKAAEHGVTLSPEDVTWEGGQPTIDGMDPADWLADMADAKIADDFWAGALKRERRSFRDYSEHDD